MQFPLENTGAAGESLVLVVPVEKFGKIVISPKTNSANKRPAEQDYSQPN